LQYPIISGCSSQMVELHSAGSVNTLKPDGDNEIMLYTATLLRMKLLMLITLGTYSWINTILKLQESERFRESWPHVRPTHCLCGSHILFRWDPHGTHVLFRRDPRGTHALFRRDPRGTHVLFIWTHVGPTVLLSDSFLS